MNVNNVSLIISAVSAKQYPNLNMPEIAFVGRSNVGKSSLINKLINRKAFARVSSVPGKTATINFYNIEDKFLFVDLPGYGYAKRSKADIKKWGEMIEEYLVTRENLSLITMLVDIRHKPSNDDVLMMNWLHEYDIKTVIVATKKDKISKKQVEENLKIIKGTLKLSQNEIVIPFSAENGEGKNEIWEIYDKLMWGGFFMKYIRYQKDNIISNGILENDVIYEISGSFFENTNKTGTFEKIQSVKILPPVMPTKIVAVGLNYKDHAKEMNEEIPTFPKLFLKPSTSIIGQNDNIVLPKSSKRVDYEAELAFVIKKTAKNVKKEDAKDYILGYTCLNDVTARDLQKLDGQWTRAKGFDTFCPIGPFITDEIDPFNANISLLLNGEVRQKSNTSNFIFDVYTLLSMITEIMTLNPGDVVTTGTAGGIGAMKSGDVVEVIIEGIGSLKNFVV